MKKLSLLIAIIAVCTDNNLEEVFVNDQDELFTQEHLALNSVGGDKNKVSKITKAEAEQQKKQLEAKEKAVFNETKAASTAKPKAKASTEEDTKA